MQSIKHRVYYYETDRMGRVYHSNFLNWMEIGRTEFLRNNGVIYKELEDIEGVILPIREINVKYINPVEYDEEILIDVDIEKISRVKIEFAYKFYSSDREVLFGEAKSVNIFADKSGKPIRVSNEMLVKLGGENG